MTACAAGRAPQCRAASNVQQMCTRAMVQLGIIQGPSALLCASPMPLLAPLLVLQGPCEDCAHRHVSGDSEAIRRPCQLGRRGGPLPAAGPAEPEHPGCRGDGGRARRQLLVLALLVAELDPRAQRVAAGQPAQPGPAGGQLHVDRPRLPAAAGAGAAAAPGAAQAGVARLWQRPAHLAAVCVPPRQCR